MGKKKRFRNKSKTGRRFLGIGLMLLALYAWTFYAETRAHIAPDYPMEDIREYLYKGQLTEGDYSLLFYQTGLAKAGVDALRSQGRPELLLELQRNYFDKVEITCSRDSFIAMGERLAKDCKGQRIPVAETGDILITFNSHVLGWRSGHAALVIDGEERLTLEAQVPGKNSGILSLERWENYPGFAVLRLKNVTDRQQEELGEYARERLEGIPYRLTAGLKEAFADGMKGKLHFLPDIVQAKADTDTEERVQLSGTHCAHLVWYAYRKLGVNLDSDGGMIVTPRDLYDSPYLEIIQIYGLEP
ncbi:MAG: hypothetical protein NC081_02880 [Roseburia sp.]|nr:hypothetical protein [Roseburia sp.]